jgi:hypothetical protein
VRRRVAKTLMDRLHAQYPPARIIRCDLVKANLPHPDEATVKVILFATFGTQDEAQAQSFPAGIIRIIVPASVSTPPDILARIIANALSLAMQVASRLLPVKAPSCRSIGCCPKSPRTSSAP